MFPTLCFVDISSGSLDDNGKELLEGNLDDEEYDLVSGNSIGINFKFKVLEFFDNIRVTLANI